MSSRPAWSTEFQDSQDYIKKPYLKKTKINNYIIFKRPSGETDFGSVCIVFKM